MLLKAFVINENHSLWNINDKHIRSLVSNKKDTNEKTDVTTKYKIKFVDGTRSVLTWEIFDGRTFIVFFFSARSQNLIPKKRRESTAESNSTKRF